MLNIAILYECVCPRNVQQLITKRDEKGTYVANRHIHLTTLLL